MFVIYVVHNNLFSVENKFSRPGLGYSPAGEPCLRLHKMPASKAVCLLYTSCDPMGIG
jgi:hypothetical protein